MTDSVRVRLPWWWGRAPERLPTLATSAEELGPAGAELGQLAADELRRHWADLGDWVSWFVDRYHLADDVPPCWPRHPALVDELIASHPAEWERYCAGDAKVASFLMGQVMRATKGKANGRVVTEALEARRG